MYTYEDAIKSSIDYFNGDELAAKVWVDKYALRDNDDNLMEINPIDMHHRIAKEFARIEKNKFKQPLSEEEIFGLLDKFKYIIPQGSPMFGIGNNYKIISLSNCYLLDVPLDSYSSILEVDEQLVNISKRRGGVGIDLSNLRPYGAPTNNSSKSSTGIPTWMERYSNSIREVGQQNRRGALMLTIDVRHPDIFSFATIKNDDSKVTGANISIRLNREFLKAVKEDLDYTLQWPIDSDNPSITKVIKAKELWNTIIHSAWMRAEPGLLMWSNVTENTPADCYEDYKSRGTNPSLRWNTLVDCQTIGDAKITKKTIKELSDLCESFGNPNGVFVVKNINDEWKPAKCFCSGKNKQLWKITLEHGKEIYCTAEHKWPVLLDYSIGFEPLFDSKTDKLIKIETKDLIAEEHYLINNWSPIKIKSVEKTEIYEDVYDITVYDDTHTFTIEDNIVTGNCSELNLSPLDSCRLLCLNLYSYVSNPFTDKSEFNHSLFMQHTIIAQRLMDDLVDLENEKIQKIIDKVESDPEPENVKRRELSMWKRIQRFNIEGRRTGTGITALGDCLAALGVKYGSQSCKTMVDKIFSNLKHSCYSSSVEMAIELGSFVGYDSKKEKNCPYIKQIAMESPLLYADMMQYGRRNICLTTVAPTGTVSIMTQTTSGIEPLFMIGYKRRRKINHADKNVKVDFVDKSGDKWEEFMVYHSKVAEWMKVTGKTNIEESPWFGCTANEINWEDRVDLQSIMQKHICHSISSTVNLPENVSEADVAKIYEKAFSSNCKGITVYRDNCRSGVLISTDKKEEIINKNHAPKRPRQLKCNLHHTVVKGVAYYVAIGMLNNEPYEVFVGRNTNSEGESIVPKSRKNGFVYKKKQGEYEILDDKEELITTIYSSQCEEHEEALARMTSVALRHGADVHFITETLLKVRGEMNSFAKSIARSLKEYIKDGTKSKDKCPECESSLIYTNGCNICQNCGYSKCN